MRPEPKPYERYRHFKGRDYQVLLIAVDAGSGRKCVVYQALYEPFRIYVRDLEEFLSGVDRDKYPYAQQKDRFVLLEGTGADSGEGGSRKDIHVDTPAERVKEKAGEKTPERNPEKDQEKDPEKTEKVRSRPADPAEQTRGTAEKLPLYHKTEGKSIFKSRDGAKREKEETIRVVDPGCVKKPEAEQPAPAGEKPSQSGAMSQAGEQSGGAAVVDPSLTMFLDAGTVEKKLEVLFREHNKLTPKTLTLIELSLGLEVLDSGTEERYQRIRSNLQMRQKYERHREGG